MGLRRSKGSKPFTGSLVYRLAGVLVAVALASVAAPAQARAEGCSTFCSAASSTRACRRRSPPMPSRRRRAWSRPTPLAAAASGSAGGNGRFVAYCVRLCDGQHFPLDHMTNATPVETCRAMCPASKTKMFFGSEIDRAVARDGARYADLDNAFVYRQHLVPNCTCNGKDAFGLASSS